MLSPAAFDRAFTGPLSQPVAWRQAFQCPCFTAASGAADPNCTICSAKGVYWSAEVQGRCGLSNQNQSKAFAQFGEWQAGDALLTIPEAAPFYLCGRYDRFRALNSIERYSVAIEPDVATKLFGTIVSVDSVQWKANDAIVQGAIPTVGADGSLTFAESGPPEGVGYIVNGKRFVEYYAYLDQPSNRNIGVTGLPRKLPVRRLDLFVR